MCMNDDIDRDFAVRLHAIVSPFERVDIVLLLLAFFEQF